MQGQTRLYDSYHAKIQNLGFVRGPIQKDDYMDVEIATAVKKCTVLIATILAFRTRDQYTIHPPKRIYQKPNL